MISKYRHKELSWIDLESPKTEEIACVIDEYPKLEFIKDEFNKNNKDHRIEVGYDTIFASLNLTSENGSDRNDKLTFIINDDLILTIHDRPMEAIRKFAKELELDIYSKSDRKIENNRALFAHLLKNLYTHSENELTKNKIEMQNLKNKIAMHNKKLKKVVILTTSFFAVIMLILLYVISNI